MVSGRYGRVLATGRTMIARRKGFQKAGLAEFLKESP
jgi:hypothetical protein